MTILCCGDRNWNNALVIRNALLDYIRNDKDLTIIHGNANGADRMCAFVALELGLNQSNIKSFPANWNKFGGAAGSIRNKIYQRNYLLMEYDSQFKHLEQDFSIDSKYLIVHVNFCKICHYVWKAPKEAKQCVNCK